jgi:hypothetical protein
MISKSSVFVLANKESNTANMEINMLDTEAIVLIYA